MSEFSRPMLFLHFLRDRLLQRPLQFLLIGVFGVLEAGLLFAAVVAFAVTPALPRVDTSATRELSVPLRVFTADGALIADFGEEKRLPVRIDDVPPMLVRAFLAAEDHTFFFHHGVDYAGVLRAAWHDAAAGSANQGGSTITMQVARNYFLSPEKSYTRKIKEVLLAFALERQFKKKQILEFYLNKVFLGQRAYGVGAAAQIYYGKDLADLTLPEMAMIAGLPKAPSRDNPISNPAGARARRDYVLWNMYRLGDIDAAELRDALARPDTAARHTLIATVEAPYVAEMARRYMLDKYGDDAYRRGFDVYTTLRAGAQRAANDALRGGLLAYDRRHGYRGPAGHVTLPVGAGPESLRAALDGYHDIGGLVPGVVTAVTDGAAFVWTQDGAVVKLGWKGLSWARRYISVDAVGAFPKRVGDVVHTGDIVYLERVGGASPAWVLAQPPAAAGALVALRPRDGAVIALAGGFDFYDTRFNHVTQAARQPGSSFKPFVYTAALAKGYTAATTFSGAPIVLEDGDAGEAWRPEDYSHRFFGPTRLRRALAMSMNLVSLRVLRAIEVPYAVDYLERFGFDERALPQDMSLALGSGAVSPLQLATAFAVFANGGFKVAPYFIGHVEDRGHHVLEYAQPGVACDGCDSADAPVRHASRVLSPDLAFLMTSMLQDVIRYGTAHAAAALGRHDLAGKTGTSNDFRDAWFSGFNRDVVATTWIGFDQPASLGHQESGARVALPVWMDFMRTVLGASPDQPPVRPAGIVIAAVNRATGMPAAPQDPNSVEEYFIRGTETRTQGPVSTSGNQLAYGAAPHRQYLPRSVREGLF